jgi:molybdopterin synthase sulfur carrier subunit
VKIMFFARLRELLGSDTLEIADADCPIDVAGLRAMLRLSVNPDLADSLADPNVFCAVNQKVVSDDEPLASSDEVGFFPPMTGG